MAFAILDLWLLAWCSQQFGTRCHTNLMVQPIKPDGTGNGKFSEIRRKPYRKAGIDFLSKCEIKQIVKQRTRRMGAERR